MKKRLSTSMTFFWKYIFSSIWLLGFSIGTIGAFISLGLLGFFFLGGLFFGYKVFEYGCLKAKIVAIDDRYLYVSNFRKEIKIPLEDIKRVTDNVMFTPRPVFIELSRETDFGWKIMFIGTTEMFLFFNTHPAVLEIRARKRLLAKAQNRNA